MTKAILLAPALLAIAGLTGCGAPPEPIIPLAGTMNYTCAGGAALPVTYLPGPNGQNALVLPAFGMNHNLVEQGSAGTIRRFAGLPGGSNMVWQVEGNTGTLSAVNPATGTMTTSMSGCRPAMPAS